MKKPERRRDLAFVVEGPTDAAVVQTLALRLGADPTGLAIVPMMGNPRARAYDATVLTLLAKGFPRVVVVFDTDATGEEALDVVTRTAGVLDSRVGPGFSTHHKEGNVTYTESPVAFVGLVPDIEQDWLCKAGQARTKDPGTYARLAGEIDLDRLRRTSTSFRVFERQVREFATGTPSPAPKAKAKPANPRLRKTA